MSLPVTQPRRTYSGLVTDSTRWKGFQYRHGDVVICTPMKSGTTWAQAIVAILLSRDRVIAEQKPQIRQSERAGITLCGHAA